MASIISRFEEIACNYDAILCDLWGVYHNGVHPYQHALDALKDYRTKQGGRVALLTNAPRPNFSVAKQLDGMGAPHDTYDVIVTSGDATITALEAGNFGQTCCHIGPERDHDLFVDLDIERVPMDRADFILCSGLFDDSTEGPEDYAESIEAGIARGLLMLCANPDVIVDRAEKRLYCAGAIAAAYERAGGEARYFGKPHTPIYEQALAKLTETAGREIPRSRILAIGDGPATDVKGAAANGFDALFVAGGLGAEMLLNPDGDIRGDRLDAYLKEHGAAPRYAISMLR